MHAQKWVSIINMFNIDKFDATKSSNSKAHASTESLIYLDLILGRSQRAYRRYVNIMPDILTCTMLVETRVTNGFFNRLRMEYGQKEIFWI